jgi:protein-tyrosine phosphatase
MSPDAAVHLDPYGATAAGFSARQLTAPMLREAGLVLAATEAIRSRALEEAPAALRRTFTVREFAALVGVVPAGGDPADLVARAAAERSRAPLDDYDIPDPYGRGTEANAHAAQLMAQAVERIAAALTG